MDNFIKCTNGVRFRHVPEKLFNSPAFKRTEWVKVEEVQTPPVTNAKHAKARKVQTPSLEEILNEDASGLLEEFESLPETNQTFQNL
jgi:hypothetical protein